jgi:hypothetical protein
MELYNDLIFSGKGLNDIINDDNIYTNQGIIFKSINSNQDLSINADSNYLKFSVKPTSIDINYNKSISFNNILHISSNSNVGIGLINPQNTLDVAGTISCGDININNSIFDKDIIKNIGFSTKDFDKGILNIFNGGTNTNNINEEQLLFGKFEQSPFLIWKNDERRLGIETENPVETLDISGDMNSLYYRINGNDIGNIFVKDFYSSSNDCFKNCSNITFYTSADYTSMISYNLTNIINSRTIDWVKNNEKNHYIQSKVGIGTDIPSYKLDIKGDINYTGELRIKGYLNKVFDGNYAYLNNSPGYTWDISNANLYNLNKGSVGIGTEIPKYTLDVNGSINYRSDIRKNGNIINIFDGNYKNLIDTPTLSKFAYSGSFYDLTELPYIFNGIYSNLNNKPLFFPTNWDSNYILNMPTYFNTNWDTHVMNKPEYFTTNWNKYVKNKPKFFDVDYNINIKNKPLYLPADWNKTIVNKPINYNVDWDSNIYNKPDFSEFAYTGDFKNLLNKPFIFSGLYRELREKPYFSKVAFTGNYNDLLNRPNLFSGEYNELLDTPIYFKSDYNLNIINKPDFPTIAFSGLFKDIVGVSSIKNWGENGTHIYSCNLSNIGIGITNPSFKLDIKGMINLNDGLIFNNINNFEKNNPWGVYFAEDFDGSLLRDSSGNERHATTSTGNITKTSGAGSGALGNINYLTGGTSSVVNWPTGSIPVNFTILSLTRYTGGSRKRILTSDFSGGNFLHGHWGYDFNTNEYRGRGCVYYEGWKSRYSSPILGNLDDWLCCIGKNSETTPNNILFDGVPSGTENGGVGGYKLCINDIGENSDWAFGCVIIWDYHLTDEDCLFYNNIIQNYLNLGGSIKKFFKDNGIIINNNCYFKNSNNFNFLTTSNDLYITSNWIVDSNSNLYNLNKGSVGINNINPSTSYKLDVNGIINTNSYLNLLKNNISWSSYNSYINLNTLSVVSINEITNSKFLNPIINITGTNNTINIANDNPLYKYVFFANSGTFKTDIDIICDILVVGGGGGGAGHIGGGGGGGSVVYIRNATILSGTYNVVVGNGGAGTNKGQNSSFAGIIAEGGGLGGKIDGRDRSGGSGGGANPFIKNFTNTINLGGSVGSESTLNNFLGIIYGNKGGDGLEPINSRSCCGGGGGAGEAGGNANSDSTQSGGKGGDGILINITGTDYYWGAGGGGSQSESIDDGVTSRAGNGGLGGGGGGSSGSTYHGRGGINGINNGTTPTNNIGGSGGKNTGSGGGGGIYNNDAYGVGGAGGSGVVIIRYAINQIYNQLNNLNIKSDLNKKLILTNGNNNEVLFLNSGNIGIGTTNPSSTIHLHNISSNQEVKLSLSPVFSIAKNTDNDGIIWNSNKGISFGTNKIERLSLINIEKRDPWGIYFAGNYSNNTLYDLSGNGRHAITTGDITSNNSSDVFGARGIIKSISGGISSTISWPTGSIPENFTILSLTRYTNTNNNTNRGRILQGQIRNFLHGHHNNRRGLCHYDGWKTIEKSIGNINDWLCCIGRNGGTTPKNIIVDYSEIGYEIGGYGNDDLRINLGAHPDEKSDWALSYVVIWNRHLTDDEMFSNNLLLINYLLTGSEPSFISENRGSKIEINNNSINLNNAFNQKVEINLTDSSSSTLGFSIYKSINNDGNLFNNKNNNLIFGTNNTEKLRITNSGNIGIGTTIPSSAIHLHNISNQEVKLSLSSVFSIAKNAINDGVIWNSNKGIYFGTNNIERLSLNNIEKKDPWGIYFAGNYSNNTLYDLSGNGRHAITTGAITSNNSSDVFGAKSIIKSISGGISSTITWTAGSIPENFTILSLTRYTGGNRGRILQSSDENWIHGHHGGNRGVCYYNGWKTTYPLTETLDNWLCCIGKNSSTTPYNIFVDGKAVGKYSGGDGNKTLVIKNTGEISDWALSYVIIWNRHLTDDEMFSNSKLITNYLSSGTEPSFISANGGSKIEINNNSINLHNLLNQKVEINLTDSSSTLGFSIYKSSNNDGNLFNVANSNLIFGTNNTEKLRITNYGNVGIGITIPSSAIHLHNILSNQEVKLSLSSVFSIAKNAINDGIIWNSNKGISFGTNNIERLSLNNIEKREPVGIYFAGNYSNNTLYDLSGYGKHAITTGDITLKDDIGNGASSTIRSISGGISSTITWPAGSIPNNFTILSLTRYTGASKGRILHDNGGWIHGHHGGFRGVCYYNGWKTIQESIGTLENWLCCIGKNSSTTPNNILIDGRSKGNLSGGDGNKTLVINIGGETSDWALSWIIIWNRHLTDDEMFSNSSLLTNYLLGTWPSFVSPNRGCKIEINNNSINLHNISSNQKVEINLTDSSSTLGFSIYKSSNNDGNLFNVANSNLIFGTNNIERLRITNSGNVGIGTTNPTNILDVNGTIQGNFRGNGANLNNLDFIKFTNGLLPVANGGTGLSNISNNFLLIGNGTGAITQTSNLIWINDNLGVNNTNPQHKLDVNGTISCVNFIGSGSNISNLDLTKFSSGLLSINCGGLGTSTLISNQILIGNGTGAITQTTNLFWNNRLGIKNSAPTCALDVSGDIKATYFYGNGSNLTNLNPNNINITIPVNRGGTGQLTLTSNYILIGNGTNSITQSINLFWNNTSSNLGINKSNPEYNLDIDGILKSSSNISTINGSNITNLNVSNISSGTLPVASGGIGTSTLISNQILIGNGTGAITQTTNLTWDNTNNRLGINKSVPTTTLDIVGNINFTGNLRQNGEIYSGVGKKFYWTSSPSFFSTTELTYRNSGSVGIGTHIIDKTYLLHVNGNIKCSKLITSINKYNITSDNHGVFSPNVLIINNRYTSESSKILFNLDTKIDLNDNNIQFETKLLSDISSNGFYFNNGNVGISTNSSRYRLSVYNANTSFNKNLSYHLFDINNLIKLDFNVNATGSYNIIDNSENKVINFNLGGGTIQFNTDIIANVLLYGGGGSGGGINDGQNRKSSINNYYYSAGGGGGGGVGFGTIKFKKDIIYNINVGSGGDSVYLGNGNNGGDTSIIGEDINEIAYGGGGGSRPIIAERRYIETTIITSTQTISFPTDRICEVLLVGGGGGGGRFYSTSGSGGGGGGGVGVGTIKFKKNINYTITIGLGGDYVTNVNSIGRNGQNTSIFGTDINEIAYGGGGGGGGAGGGGSGGSGGSGGGGKGGATNNGGIANKGLSSSSSISLSTITYFGSSGGNVVSGASGGGGGGGANNSGENNYNGNGGNGGNGYLYNGNYYGGGGGGGRYWDEINPTIGGKGGLGGGGSGGTLNIANYLPKNGTDNTGGGGGGDAGGWGAGKGGSGIVIIRYFDLGGWTNGTNSVWITGNEGEWVTGGNGGIANKGLSSSLVSSLSSITYYGNNNGGPSSSYGTIGGSGGGAGGGGTNMNGGTGIIIEDVNYGSGGGGASGHVSNTTQRATNFGRGGQNNLYWGDGESGMLALNVNSIHSAFRGWSGGGGGGGGSFGFSGRGGDGGVIIKIDYTKQIPQIKYYENTNISNISAEFRNTIQVKGDIVASSDNRIKKDIFDINSKNALDLISRINPKSFNYIDNIDKGFKNNYGFIAQDIIKNIPDAVRFTKDIIPNIMKKYRINNDIIETNEDLTSKLYINDNIEIIDKDNNRNKYKILDISSNYIKIDKSIEDNYGFIYGKEVEDFHILDKKIIFTLNVSATQELNKRIKKQQRKLLKQEMKLIKQEKIIKEQELKFEEQEKQLKYLFINYY